MKINCRLQSPIFFAVVFLGITAFVIDKGNKRFNGNWYSYGSHMRDQLEVKSNGTYFYKHANMYTFEICENKGRWKLKNDTLYLYQRHVKCEFEMENKTKGALFIQLVFGHEGNSENIMSIKPNGESDHCFSRKKHMGAK